MAITAKYLFAYSHQQRTIGRLSFADGKVDIVQSDVKGCSAMVTDDKELYWVEPGDARVRALAFDSTEARVVSQGFSHPWDLAVDASHLWLTDRKAGTILRVSKQGGRAQIVAQNQTNPLSLAVDDEFVYWVEPDKGTIVRVPKPPVEQAPPPPSAN